MGLGSGSSGLNQLLSKFGYVRLPKSDEQQPLLAQDNHHYQFQAQEDEHDEKKNAEKYASLNNEIRRINASIYNLESAIYSTSWIDIVNLCIKPIQKEFALLAERVAKLEKASTPKSEVDVTPLQKELSELKAKVAKLEKSQKTPSITANKQALVRTTQNNYAASEKKLADLTTSIQMLKFKLPLLESLMHKKEEAVQKLQMSNVALEKKLDDLTTSIQLLNSNMLETGSLAMHASSSSQSIIGNEVDTEVNKLLFDNNRDDLQVAFVLLIFFIISIVVGYCVA